MEASSALCFVRPKQRTSLAGRPFGVWQLCFRVENIKGVIQKNRAARSYFFVIPVEAFILHIYSGKLDMGLGAVYSLRPAEAEPFFVQPACFLCFLAGRVSFQTGVAKGVIQLPGQFSKYAYCSFVMPISFVLEALTRSSP